MGKNLTITRDNQRLTITFLKCLIWPLTCHTPQPIFRQNHVNPLRPCPLPRDRWHQTSSIVDRWTETDLLLYFTVLTHPSGQQFQPIKRNTRPIMQNQSNVSSNKKKKNKDQTAMPSTPKKVMPLSHAQDRDLLSRQQRSEPSIELCRNNQRF